MKILHISTARSWRGGEQQIAYLVSELQKFKLAQAIVCAQGSKMEEHCRNAKIEHFPFPNRFSLDPLFAKNLKKACEQFKADLMHIHDSHAHTFAILSVVLFGNKPPGILSRRVDFPISGNPFSRFKYNHSSIKKTICVSNRVREILSPSIQQKEKLLTVYSGIDLSRFEDHRNILRKEFKISDDELIIGNVAAIAPHKDYPTFLRTVCLLKTKIKAKYLIIGDGPLRKTIESQIQQLGLKNDVILTEHRHDIDKILPELDVFLFTSKTEGLGTSILDAFACRVPVVATKAGGVPEIVIHEKTGLLSPVGDAETLASQVLRLINESELKKQLVKNAYDSVQEFSKENMARKTLEVYKQVLGRTNTTTSA